MKRIKLFMRLLIALSAMIVMQNLEAQTTGGLELYTPYTMVSLSPGKSVSYSIDLINEGEQTRNEIISVSNIPRSWEYTLTAGAYTVKKVAIRSGEKKTLNLKVNVPYQVRKGNYTFYVKAGKNESLPLTINVSSGGSSESELSCEQKNMEGTAKSSFTFKAVLKNRTATKQQYALMADAPRGWTVAIKPNYKQATSTEVEANSTKDITYDIKAPATVEAGKYTIPVKAIAGSTSAELEFEVVITGTYEILLTTPSGLLSTHMTAGREKKIEFTVINKGSAQLENISLSDSKPKNWDITLDPKKIEHLAPGESETVYATITADKKAIPGDYLTKFTVRTPEASADVSFRVSVKTSVLIGWLGVLIIAAALGGVFFLFKKFGRR